MRIGVVSYDYSPAIGGLGRVASALIGALTDVNPGLQFTIVSPSARADERVSTLAISRWRKRGGCPLFSLLLLWKLPVILRRHRVDVLHVHAGSGGVWLLRRPTCPLVVTAHHTYRDEADYVFRDSPVLRWWKLLMATLEARTYRLADRVVCVSADTAASVVQRYGIDRSKVSVIENGMVAHPVPSVRKDAATVLFIGRLESRKGVETLIRAFAIVREALPSAHLRLVGENLLGASLHAMMHDAGIAPCSDVAGYLPEADMRHALAAATLLVVPSLLEGFGLIAAEGMLAGTCVVASDCPGLRSIVSDGVTGLLFRSGDAADCARAILRLLRDSGLRDTLANQARIGAHSRFSPELRAREYDRLFAATARS